MIVVTRLERYESSTSIPLAAGAGLFLVVYAIPVVWPGVGRTVAVACEVTSLALWLVFAADLAARATLSGHPLRYLRRNLLDVVVVVVPVFRPLRVLLLLTATKRLFRRGGLTQGARAAVVSIVLIVLVAAIAELEAERGAPGANITSFGNSLWWAVATVTTVGYGDLYPVTLAGRLVATALMFVGIALVGIMTAAVAAWFVTQDRDAEADADATGPR